MLLGRKNPMPGVGAYYNHAEVGTATKSLHTATKSLHTATKVVCTNNKFKLNILIVRIHSITIY